MTTSIACLALDVGRPEVPEVMPLRAAFYQWQRRSDRKYPNFLPPLDEIVCLLRWSPLRIKSQVLTAWHVLYPVRSSSGFHQCFLGLPRTKITCTCLCFCFCFCCVWEDSAKMHWFANEELSSRRQCSLVDWEHELWHQRSGCKTCHTSDGIFFNTFLTWAFSPTIRPRAHMVIRKTELIM